MTLTIPWLERRRLVKQLEDIHQRYTCAGRLAETLGLLNEYFNLCIEIAEFNRAHPELTIPKLLEGRVLPSPLLTAPQSA